MHPFNKKSLGLTKMKKSMRSFSCKDGSTSTFNKQNSKVSSQPTLEDLILQVELEAKLNDDFGGMRGRMSCVSNSSNILSSSRKGLNQYPRFSLDSRDVMHSSTFVRNIEKGRRSFCCERRIRGRLLLEENVLPTTLGGERVVWCKPGVVARLMGLEAMPLPVISCKRSNTKRDFIPFFF